MGGGTVRDAQICRPMAGNLLVKQSSSAATEVEYTFFRHVFIHTFVDLF